jgi:EAL domain-containing protein (putative c-di-GMP-specific phosphodiesterase class I)
MLTSELTQPSNELHSAEKSISYAQQGIYVLGSRRQAGRELLLRKCRHHNLADMLETPHLFVEHLDDLIDSKLELAKRKIGTNRGDGRLFVNMTPSQLCSNSFERQIVKLADYHDNYEKIVIEVTENEGINDWSKIKGRLHLAKEAGLEIAVDDFGAGHSNIKSLIETGPDFVKVDRHILNAACENIDHENFLYSLVSFIHNLGMKAILEGVETAKHLTIAIKSRAAMGQGFHLHRPTIIE